MPIAAPFFLAIFSSLLVLVVFSYGIHVWIGGVWVNLRDVKKEETGSCEKEEKTPDECNVKEDTNQSVDTEKEEGETLSKSAMKKKEKMRKLQEYWKEKKKLKKQQKKEKAKMVKKEPAKDGLNLLIDYPLDNLTPEEKARLKEMRLQERAKWLEDLKTSPRVLIDLDFQELMRPNEISSLTQQVMYSYGFIRRAKRPLRLVLTSVKDEIKTKLEKIQGFHSWLASPLLLHDI